MSAFVSTMRFVGDLDDRFYEDELARDVWNEASAVGYQLTLWAATFAMAVLPWVAGRPGAWVTVGLFVAMSAIAVMTLAYSRSRGVDVHSQSKLLRPRAALLIVLYVMGGIGVLLQLRATDDDPLHLDFPTIAGAVVGGAIGVGLASWIIHRRRKHQQALDLTDDDL